MTMTSTGTTDARDEAREQRSAHPRGLGAFGFPEGLMLLGDDERALDLRAELAAGRLPEPATWPAELAGVVAAHTGDADPASPLGLGGVATYNRWVLDPQSAGPDDVRAALPAGVRPLVDVVGWTVGLTDAPAVPDEAARDTEPEVSALVLATLASRALESGDPATALGLLDEAASTASAVAPALAAMLTGNAASLLRQHGAGADRVVPLLSSAAAGLAGTDLHETRAELLHELGLLAHERAATAPDEGTSREAMREAMQHYYDALTLVTEESAPLTWASVQLDLAAAHLATPMTSAGDQLRLGVAAQSLRACRRVFDPAEHPGPWSTATLNLANALVYTPSAHRADNLVEAVGLYEEVLASGVRSGDTVGRARLLTNLGNTLAHLGVLDDARRHLADARFLFESVEDHDGAATARGLIDEVARAEAAAGGASRSGEEPDPLADLARQAERMSQVPGAGEGAFTSGMGVTVTPMPAGEGVPPERRVTRVSAAERPTTVQEESR